MDPSDLHTCLAFALWRHLSRSLYIFDRHPFQPAGQDRYIADRTRALLSWTAVPSLRRLTLHLDLPIPLDPPRVESALLSPASALASPRWLRRDNLRFPRVPRRIPPSVGFPLSPPSSAWTLVLEVKRLTDDYDAPDARPALILAAAPSVRGLTLYLDPRTALDTPGAANGTQSASAPRPAPPRRLRRVHRRPTPSVLFILRLTRPRRPASPPRLPRTRRRPSPPPSHSSPRPSCQLPTVPATLRLRLGGLSNSGPLGAYMPGPTRRHTLTLGVAYD
ncbi:hypothetical protein DFH08DRAFT_331887 [Mycena albidolilacea]|uniref:Uncharacterized protein n=1 Tax=Mycena albidolilacea TaxID=1033008 RepID=A0AAD6ZKD9_9AGAR|nr:hypothetical protein DFH08DRAFT_331887 [Mycena albidolilacea]